MTNPFYDTVARQAENEGAGHYPFPDDVSLREPLEVHEYDANLPESQIATYRESRVPEPVQIRTPAVIHYPKSRDVIPITSGVNINEQSLGFDCRAIAIQTMGTNGVLFCPELNIYLTVGQTLMNVINIPSGIDNISFLWHTAVFNPATPAQVAGQYAIAWLYDEWVMPEEGGGPVTISAGSSIAIDELPAPFITADAEPDLAVSRIGDYQYVYNGSWNRLRGPGVASGGSQAAVGLQYAVSMLQQGVNDYRTMNTVAAVSDATAMGNSLSAGYWVYNGATWDRVRTPNIFKTVQASALGATALWTPAAGKKFRLMGYSISVPSEAAAAGATLLVASFLDAATATNLNHDFFVPAVSVVTAAGQTNVVVQLGNGLLSAVANNVLNANLSVALTAGAVRYTCWGTEE